MTSRTRLKCSSTATPRWALFAKPFKHVQKSPRKFDTSPAPRSKRCKCRPRHARDAHSLIYDERLNALGFGPPLCRRPAAESDVVVRRSPNPSTSHLLADIAAGGL